MESDEDGRPPQRFGLGGLPPELDRVCWPAVLLPFLWALAWGLWPWLALFAAVRVASSLLSVYVYAPLAGSSFALDALANVMFMLLALAPAVAFGLKANATLWDYEEDRIYGERRSWPLRPPAVASYLDSQRAWAQVGLLLLLAGFMGGLWQTFESDSSQVPAVLVGNAVEAAILIALLIMDRRKRGGSS